MSLLFKKICFKQLTPHVPPSSVPALMSWIH